MPKHPSPATCNCDAVPSVRTKRWTAYKRQPPAKARGLRTGRTNIGKATAPRWYTTCKQRATSSQSNHANSRRRCTAAPSNEARGLSTERTNMGSASEELALIKEESVICHLRLQGPHVLIIQILILVHMAVVVRDPILVHVAVEVRDKVTNLGSKS